MADVVEIDGISGEVVERDFTPEELAQRELDIQAALDSAAAAAAAAAARESAMSKLSALGLTEEEISALLS